MATFQVTSDNGTTATVVTAASTTFTLDGALRGPKGDDAAPTPDATSSVKGKVRLTGDLGGTSDSPTVPGLTTKATDSAVVHNSGDESVAGIKTFSSSPIVPTPTSPTHTANKTYVDGVVGTGSTPDADASTKGKVQLGGELAGISSTAAAPTIKNMLRVFNVKDYGAIGDGSTDDLTAIQNAINAATSVGGIVFFPAATYIVSNSIVPKNNVTLQGVQNISILKMSASAGRTIKLINAALTNFTIDSMTFSGSVNSFPTVPTRTRTISGNGAETAVYITGDQDPFTAGTGAISNITLRNCKIQNHSALPIRISGTTGTIKVVDCDFINNQDPGFIFNDEVIFNNNHCMNGADNGVSLSRGNKKVTCVGNTIENVAFQGIFIAGFDINGDGDIQNAGPTNFTVTGNTIKNCGYNGIYADAAPKHGVISGNVVQQGYYRGPVGSTTITAGSNGVTLPQTTINVVSTIGFSGSGSFTLNSETITYTGITSTTFTGCSGGTSTLATGDTVSILKTDINSTGIYIAGYPFPYNQATTIAAGSNGLTLPQATITVASTSSFPSVGSFTLNSEIITYTGKTSTTFTGCSGGTSTMATGNTVTMVPSAYAENIQITGNTLYQCARAGVELFAAKHIAIDSNLIVDCGTEFLADGTTTIGSTSVASNVGILIHSAGTPVDISVRNNTITETRTGSVSNTNGQYTNYGIVPYTNIPSTYTYANNRMSGCRNAYNITDWSSDNHIYSGNGAIIQTKGLNDPHDNRVMTITDNASTAPNFLNVQGSIAGQAVALSAESFTETVIPFTIRSKGAATFAIRPGADLTTAIQFRRANSNPAVNIDTNRGDNLSRVGVNTATPASEMHVVGDVRSTNLILTNPLATTYGGTGQANLTSLPLTTPQITNGLNDSNGNRMITFTAVSSAVTNLTLQNATTGNNVAIGVSSTDTNAGISLKSKGNGTTVFRPETDTTLATQFRRADNLSTNSVVDIDTTNARVGINTIAPASDLHVNGDIRAKNVISPNQTIQGLPIRDLKYAIQLSGSIGSNIDLGNRTYLDGKPFTFGTWVESYNNALTDDGAIWGYGYSSGNNKGYVARVDGVTKKLTFFYGSTQVTANNTYMYGPMWLMLKYDGVTTLQVKINNVLTDTLTIAPQIADATIKNYLGSRDGTARNLNGAIDDSFLYDRVTTTEEDNSIFYDQNFPSGALFIYHFDERTGTTATDSSGSGNTGTINSGTYFVSPFGNPNKNPSIATRWQAALASADSSPTSAIFIGSSTTEGANSSTTDNRYTDVLGRELHTAFNDPSVIGGKHVRAHDSGWTTSGTAALNGDGLGLKSWSLSASATLSITITNSTGFDLHYVQGTGQGSFTVGVDGGGAVTVTPNTAAPANRHDGTYTVTGLTRGSHTVLVTATNACIINGIYVQDGDSSTGVRIYNSGLGGTASADFITSAADTIWTRGAAIGNVSLVAIMLSSNDFTGSIVPATFKANILTLINKIKTALSATSPDIVLINSYRRYDYVTYGVVYTYDQYGAQLSALAASLPNVYYVDTSPLYPLTNDTLHDPTNMMDTDNIHMTDAGHRFTARAIMQKIIPSLATPLTDISPLPIAKGGTGQSTASTGFNALSPMTTAGDIIYGGTSGAGTRLAAGTSTQLLIGGTTPAWGTVALASMVSGTLPVANGGIGQTSLTSLPLTTPQITNGINDSNGNRIVSFTATASAVTNLTIQNAATGGNVAFGISSSDTNAGATFKSKGNGTLVFRPETDTITASQWRKADNSTVVMNVDSTNGRIGIGTAAPSRTLDVVGAGRMQQLLGSSGSSPSNAADVGAGTSPTVTITGTDVAGKIVITAGTSPSASSAIIKLTFGTTYPNAPYPMIIAGNTSAAALSGTASVYVTSNTTDFTISVGSTALVNATQYIWYYHIIG